jgi:hypothetical protein
MNHMKALEKLFQKIKPLHLQTAFLMLILCKFFFLTFVLDGTIQVYKSETDADYYDWFAIGISSVAYSIWSDILKALNEFELYNRNVLRVIIYSITTLLIPFVYASLLPHVKSSNHLEKYGKIYWLTVLYISIYPTLNLFALDVFRDAIMVLLVGITFYAIKLHDSKSGTLKYSLLLLIGSLIYAVYLFRPYLGAALLVAYVLRAIHIYRVNKMLIVGLYLASLLILRALGALDFLLNYRAGFEGTGGGTLNLSLLGDSSIQFLFNYVLSILYQFFGFHIDSIQLVILFFAESIVIIISLVYIYLQRTYVTKIEEYLILFATVYAAIWTFINDNMGTAIRLRMFDYITIVVVAASLYIRQLNAQKLTKLEL